MDRWYENIDKKQHFQHVKGSGFSLLIQNFKEDLIIYVLGFAVCHYQNYLNKPLIILYTSLRMAFPSFVITMPPMGSISI